MDQMIQTWAERYYYHGMGLSVPTHAQTTKYEESYQMNLINPIKKLLGASDVQSNDVTSFLRKYQVLGVKSPFYSLSYFADNYNGGDWESEVKAMISKLHVVIGLVKDGKAMYVYERDGKIVGTFPRTVHYIGETSLAAQGEDLINILLFKSPEIMTDAEVEALKRLVRIHLSYSEAVKPIPYEHYDGMRISTDPISPLEAAFPPEAVRKLFAALPTVNEFSTKHEQAWNYIKDREDADKTVKNYLSRIEKFQTVPVVQEKNPALDGVEIPEGFAEKMKSNAFGLPSENQVFEGVGQMLVHLVQEDFFDPLWTIGDTVTYYNLPDEDNWTPLNRYEFGAGPSDDNRYIVLQALKDLMKAVQNNKRPMTVSHLMSELEKSGEVIEPENTWDILHSCLVLLNVNNNRDVASLKGKERSFEQQLQRQAVNFIKQGFNASLTLQDAAQGLLEPNQRSYNSIEEAAMAAIDSGLSPNLTLQDIINGVTEHKDTRMAELGKTIGTAVHSFSDLTSIVKSMREKSEMTDTLRNATSVAELMNSELVSDGVKEELLELQAMKEKLGSYNSLEGLADSGLLPLDWEHELHRKEVLDMQEFRTPEELCSSGMLYDGVAAKIRSLLESNVGEFDTVEQLLASEDVSPALKEALRNNTKVSNYENDFGYAVANTLLTDIREKLKESDSMGFNQAFQYKSQFIPLYYAFIRLTACRPTDREDIEKFLSDQIDKANNQLAKDIFTHGLKVLQDFS